MSLPVLVINRDQDTERMASFSASAKSYRVKFTRVSAFDAHAPDFPFRDHAHLIGDHFWGEPEIKPGAIGCFLSHRKAWEELLTRGWTHALICEDDARFLRHPTPEIAPTEWSDIIFANTRLGSWASTVSDEAAPQVGEVIGELAAIGGPKSNGLKTAPGGDAYILSRFGAEKLLERTARQKIVCGVDWAMVWNGLTAVSADDRSAFPEISVLEQKLTMESAISCRVLTSPIAGQSGTGPSTIKHSIRKPIADL